MSVGSQKIVCNQQETPKMVNHGHELVRAMALVVLIGLTACHINLISDYDDTFDQQATSTQKDVDALMRKIIDNPNPANPEFTAETYASDKEAYAKIQNELDALLVRATAHTNNNDTLDSVNKIIHSFSLIQNRHKTAPALKIEAASNELKIINDEFTALIAQELLKKEGKASSKS